MHDEFSSRPGRAYVKYALSKCSQDRRALVLIRQRELDNGPSAFARSDVAYGLFCKAVALFGGARNLKNIRWVFSWESVDRVCAAEASWSSHTWQWLSNLFSNSPRGSMSLSFCDMEKIGVLLSQFDLSETLLSCCRWKYQDQTLSVLRQQRE